MGEIEFTKVKAHVTWSAVESGAASVTDKVGNSAADELAVAGALIHRCSLQRW